MPKTVNEMADGFDPGDYPEYFYDRYYGREMEAAREKLAWKLRQQELKRNAHHD